MLMGILFLGFVVVPYIIQHGVGSPTSLLQPDASSSYNAEQEFLGLFTGGVSRKCPLTAWGYDPYLGLQSLVFTLL